MTTRSLDAPPVVSRAAVLGARFGVLFGCSAWMLMLGFVCLVNGRADALLPVVLPMLLASLALGMLVLAAFEPVMALPVQAQAKLRFPLVFGGLMAVTGILLLLAEAFVTPVLRGDPALAQIVHDTGGVFALPRWLSCVLLAAGIGVMAMGLRAAARLRTAAPGSA
ncbi:MAG: hypothetical protein AB7O97_13805 [Planctomycetota bacterium]